MGNQGLTANVYSFATLPDTVEELVTAIYEQKDLSREDAFEMARYLDKRYETGPAFVPVNVSRYGDVRKVE